MSQTPSGQIRMKVRTRWDQNGSPSPMRESHCMAHLSAEVQGVARLRGVAALGASQDGADDRGLGVGVLLHVGPGASGQLRLGPEIQLTVGRLGPQPVAE